MEFSKIVEIIYKSVATLAIILGGIWSYFHYFRGRTYKSRLQLGVQSGSVLEGKMIYLRISINAKNVGLSKAGISQKGSALRILSYKAADDTSGYSIEEDRIDTYPVFEKHGWIESGEMIDDQFVITIPNENQIGFKLELRVVSNGYEWNTSDVLFILKDKMQNVQKQ